MRQAGFLLEYQFKVLFFRLEYCSFAANFEILIHGCTMTTLEPKSTSLISKLILRKPDRNGQIISRKVSNIGPKAIHMSKDKGRTWLSIHKNREKKPEKSFLLYLYA